ncbi:hypothetical protein CONPUDRAFT_78078 [Coniophora puteana RWD-64-598 SS2]|uniref:Uncharacterized protein n=1 Tax=Coniophora puteana (strain RWD-64-598) TaxID=741705 RepID=R7SFA7_CONPW|nr:uncharacterized protein CONPUDRAFT_78078 [Coniophora puteana RWD-64-598 SS2]EIW74432.1 hypothetical protein CONPUDRAFT_78078 [Coniophora puteana RWD-64-598 SS2]
MLSVAGSPESRLVVTNSECHWWSGSFMTIIQLIWVRHMSELVFHRVMLTLANRLRYAGITHIVISAAGDLHNLPIDKVRWWLLHQGGDDSPSKAVIMIRVDALYPRVKVASRLLHSVFVISQVGNISSMVITMLAGGRGARSIRTAEVKLYPGFSVCHWRDTAVGPASSLFVASTFCFEIIALTLATYRIYTHLKATGKKLYSIWRSNNLFFLVARENLTYFCTLAIWLAFAVIDGTLSSSDSQEAALLDDTMFVLETYWTSILGPYLVLNVRRNDTKHINPYIKTKITGDTIVFASFHGEGVDSDHQFEGNHA